MNELMSLEPSVVFTQEAPAPGPARGRCRRVVLGIGVASMAALLVWGSTALTVHLVRESRLKHCALHLKAIGVALTRYHDEHGHLPAPALRGRDGRPNLSWRVALLPQLGYQSLYEQFHRDEPWDSPHNRALLAEMPPEFACPGGPARRTGKTGYLVLVGPESDPTSVNTPFEPARGVDLREITDGTSNTIAILETTTSVPWTKPDDLRWTKASPPPALASSHRGGAHALFADGTTRFLKNTIQRVTFQALLTINGGEIFGG